MGLLDSIGSLGSITKLFDVGNIVKTVADKVLPQNMHFIGDAAGAFVDFKTGNLIGAAQLGMQALKDLPQATKGQQQPQGAASKTAAELANSTKSALEPSPPPTAKDPKSFDWNDLLSAIKALTAALTGQGAKPADSSAKSADTSTKPATTTAPATTASQSAKESAADYQKHQPGWRGGPHHAASASASQVQSWQGQPQTPAAATDAASTSAKTSALTTSSASATLSDRSASAAGSAAPAKPAAATSAAPTTSAAPATSTTAPAPAADAPAAASSTTAAAKPAGTSSTSAPAAGSTDKGQTVTSVAQLNGMTDPAFLDAVRNGRISPDIAKDPTAMMAVQERMNEITQMNNLMTGMMRAIHDMQMAVIQNIRI